MTPQKFPNFIQQGNISIYYITYYQPLEKIEGTKFSNINTKNMFYDTLTLTKSESVVRKILKNF